MKDTRRAVRAFSRILDALGDAGTADALLAAEIHDDRGIVHLGDDALAQAQADFEAAYEIRLRAAGPDSVEIVSSLICHALLRTRQRAWAKARALYQAGLEILDRHPRSKPRPSAHFAGRTWRCYDAPAARNRAVCGKHNRS